MFYSKDKYSIAKYIYLRSCHSTNDYGTNVSSISNPNQNYCVYTYNQTDGKGQIGRKWHMGEGLDIACSFYYSIDDLLAKHHFYLNMAVGLSVHDTVSEYVDDGQVRIKWPNDIHVNDKKIAGILIQNQIKGKYISKTIIGVGININTESFPEELPNPTSIMNSSTKDKNLSQLKVLHSLEKNLRRRLSQMQVAHAQARKEYMEKLYRAYELHYYENKEGELIEAKIIGISEEGKLQLSTKEAIKEFAFREITYRI